MQYNNIIRQGGNVRKIQDKARQCKERQYNIIHKIIIIIHNNIIRQGGKVEKIKDKTRQDKARQGKVRQGNII
jgi:hypothetical protein